MSDTRKRDDDLDEPKPMEDVAKPEGEPDSVLGGGTATRSSTAEGPDPAEEDD